MNLRQNLSSKVFSAWSSRSIINLRAFSHDVTAAILVYQENPLGVELFSHVNAFFCSNKLALDAGHVGENAPLIGNQMVRSEIRQSSPFDYTCIHFKIKSDVLKRRYT